MNLSLWLVALMAMLASVRSQHPLTNLPPSGLVTTGYFFPGQLGKQKTVTAGKMATVVLGFHNDGKEPYNVSVIMGSLNSPTDFSIFVQNFTQTVYHQDVGAGQEISLEYKFMPDPRLEPRDFVVALTVFYQDTKGVYFSNTFFNQTVEIVEIKKFIDWELIFLFVFFVALIGGGSYLAYSFVAPHLQSMGVMMKSRKTKKKASTGPPRVQTEEEAEDWLKGTNYKAFTDAQAAKAARPPPREAPPPPQEKKATEPAAKKKA